MLRPRVLEQNRGRVGENSHSGIQPPNRSLNRLRPQTRVNVDMWFEVDVVNRKPLSRNRDRGVDDEYSQRDLAQRKGHPIRDR